MRVTRIALAVLALLISDSANALPEVPRPPGMDPNFKVPPKDSKCRALAMRGGGTKGAFEVGALKAMTEMMKPQEYAYDVVVGVSCGAINAALMAIYKRGYEKIAVEYLLKIWSTFPITDYWENWSTLGPIEGLWRSGLVNNDGLQIIIESVMQGQKLYRGMALQAVDLNDGQVVIIDEKVPMKDLASYIVASAAIPLVFPAKQMGTRTLVDGGVLSNLDLSEAVTKCNELGYKDEDIVVDMLLCFSKDIKWDQWSIKDYKYKNAYEMYTRKSTFRSFYYYYEDLTRVMRGYPKVHFRHMIAPLESVQGSYMQIFDDIEMSRNYIKHGYDDATKILEWYFEKYPQHSVNYTGIHADTKPKVQSSKDDHHLEFRPSFDHIREIIAQEDALKQAEKDIKFNQ